MSGGSKSCQKAGGVKCVKLLFTSPLDRLTLKEVALKLLCICSPASNRIVEAKDTAMKETRFALYVVHYHKH